MNVETALVRSRPDKNLPAAGKMEFGKCANFDGQTTDGTWLRLAQNASDGSCLWMVAKYITHKQANARLPVVE